jgi:hypothetical protein
VFKLLCGHGITSDGLLKGVKLQTTKRLGITGLARTVCRLKDSTNYYQNLFSVTFDITTPLFEDPLASISQHGLPVERLRGQKHISFEHGEKTGPALISSMWAGVAKTAIYIYHKFSMRKLPILNRQTLKAES